MFLSFCFLGLGLVSISDACPEPFQLPPCLEQPVPDCYISGIAFFDDLPFTIIFHGAET